MDVSRPLPLLEVSFNRLQCTMLPGASVSQAAKNATHFLLEEFWYQGFASGSQSSSANLLGDFTSLKILNNYVVFTTNSGVKFSVLC